ncbi:alpha/beta-hydrolase [Hypoxylon cercidicola]|nr:alpha/beta-hydrolase [Hypoxylon cercidicola]
MFQSVLYACIASTGLYAIFLNVFTIPFIQNQIVYLNDVTLTWFQDVNVPEQWGFLHNQVTPFNLHTEDGETLPLELYSKHEDGLLEEPSGLALDITTQLSFKLLRDAPFSLLVLYFHGAAGSLGSGWRPPSYRAMSVGAPDRIHTIAIDYRGFGTSTGFPSEEGLLKDAITLAKFAMKEAGIPPTRIVLFAQSLGTAVSISLANHMASGPNPTLFSGMVLVAPFANVELLTATYRVAGIIPVLDPIAKFPRLLVWLNTFILSKWPSKDTLAKFVRRCEDMAGDALKYHITVIHAEDDYDIPWSHSEQVFWHAVNASSPNGISYDELERDKETSKVVRGAGGWAVDHRTSKGVIREEIMKYGLHDRIMSYPVVVSLAITSAFGGR